MANAWQNPSSICAEALIHMEDGLVITNLGGTDKTADFLARPNGYAVGQSVSIKTRPEFEVNEFTTTTVKQPIRESVRSMTIEKHFDVSIEITAKEKAMNLDSFSEQVVKPAIYKLAEKCDAYVGSKILQAHGLYASNAVFGTQGDMAAARKAATLQQLGSNRLCLVDVDLETTLLSEGYFSTYAQRGEQGAAAFNQGSMGSAMGMNFFTSLQFPVDNKVATGTMVCATDNGAGGNTNNRIGDSILTVDTQTASKNVQAGDRLEVVGLRRPLVVLTTIADTDATTQIVLADPITEVVPDNAVVTVIGSGQANQAARGVIMDTSALGFAMPMLDAPSDKPSSVLSSNGFSLRVVNGYDMDSKKELMSIDCLIGAAAYDPRRMTLLREY